MKEKEGESGMETSDCIGNSLAVQLLYIRFSLPLSPSAAHRAIFWNDKEFVLNLPYMKNDFR